MNTLALVIFTLAALAYQTYLLRRDLNRNS